MALKQVYTAALPTLRPVEISDGNLMCGDESLLWSELMVTVDAWPGVSPEITSALEPKTGSDDLRVPGVDLRQMWGHSCVSLV